MRCLSNHTVRRVYIATSIVVMVTMACYLSAQVNATRDAYVLTNHLVSGCADGMIICEGSGAVLLFNKAAQNLTGYSDREVIQGGMETIIPPRFQEMHNNAMQRATDKLKASETGFTLAFRATVTIRTKSGEEFPARLSVSGAKNQSRVYFLAVIRDADAKEWPDFTRWQHWERRLNLEKLETDKAADQSKIKSDGSG